MPFANPLMAFNPLTLSLPMWWAWPAAAATAAALSMAAAMMSIYGLTPFPLPV